MALATLMWESSRSPCRAATTLGLALRTRATSGSDAFGSAVRPGLSARSRKAQLGMDLVVLHPGPGLGWPLSSGFPEEHDAVRYSWSNSKHREHTHPRDPRWSDHSSRLDPTDLMPQASGGIGS